VFAFDRRPSGLWVAHDRFRDFRIVDRAHVSFLA
jgi:hypothetical protein